MTEKQEEELTLKIRMALADVLDDYADEDNSVDWFSLYIQITKFTKGEKGGTIISFMDEYHPHEELNELH